MTVLHDETIERPFDDPPETDAKPAWGVAFKRAAAKFSLDGCTDQAAALTYYSLQSLFPALIAVLSLLNIFGNGKETTNSMVSSVGRIIGKSPEDLSSISTFINNVQTTGGGGIAFVIGILGALWSASGYVGGFSRSLNRIYAIGEGRPVWKLRPWLLLITAIEVLLILVVIASIVLTGSVAKEIGDNIGLGSQVVQVWDIAKWPFVALIVIVIISMLFRTTPNVRKSGNFMSFGAAFGFLVWVVLSIAVAIYFTLTHGASYQKTYGAFAGAIMLMLWLWLTNIALLFGAELDAEIIRTKQLKSGLPAERLVLLPARDDSGLEKQAEKDEKQVEAAHALRMEHIDSDDARRTRGTTDSGAYALGSNLSGSQHGNAATPTAPLTNKDHKPLDRGEVNRADRTKGDRRLTGSHSAIAGGVTAIDRERAEIQAARDERRDAALETYGRNRAVRERLTASEAKRQAREKKAAAKREKARKEAEANVTQQQRWAQVSSVRSQYEPRDSAARDEVMQERQERRASWRTTQKDKAQAKASPQAAHTMPDLQGVEAPPAPAPWREEVLDARAERRAQWERDHAK